MSEAQKLVACPLCGADEGYRLDEGSTYRWWSVHCAGCGQEVSEARATYPAETALRTSAADEAWNAAGAYAQSLRDRIAALEAQQAQAPDGWQLVPVEPTPEMKKAAVVYANGNAVYKNVAREALEIEESIYGEVYAAMLSAAPQQGSKS